MEAGLEIRGTATRPPTTWMAVVPSVMIDEVPNRTAFALLAGHPIPWLGLGQLFPRRGLPEDVTPDIRQRYDGWGGSADDAGWVSCEELLAAVDRLTAAVEEAARSQGNPAPELLRLHRGVSIDAIMAFLRVYHTQGFEARMIFWHTPI